MSGRIVKLVPQETKMTIQPSELQKNLERRPLLDNSVPRKVGPPSLRNRDFVAFQSWECEFNPLWKWRSFLRFEHVRPVHFAHVGTDKRPTSKKANHKTEETRHSMQHAGIAGHRGDPPRKEKEKKRIRRKQPLHESKMSKQHSFFDSFLTFPNHSTPHIVPPKTNLSILSSMLQPSWVPRVFPKDL